MKRQRACSRKTAGWLLGLALLLVASAAHARIVTEIVGIEGELRTNAQAYLDLVRFADQDDLSAAAVRRFYELAPDQVRAALRPFGYYAPRIEGSLQLIDGNWYVQLQVDPGPPVRLASVDIRIIGPGSGHPEFSAIANASPLAIGRQLDHREFDRLRAALDREAQSSGFFDRTFVESRLEVHPEEQIAHAILVMATGEQYRFGTVTVEQEALVASLVDRMVFARPGEPFSDDAVLRTQYALTDSRYFSYVLVDTGPRDLVTRTVPVQVATAPIPRQELRFGIGYGSDTHLRVTVSNEWRLVNAYGHRASVQARASWPLLSLDGQYSLPLGNPLTESLGARASLVFENLGDTRSQRGSLGVSHRTSQGAFQRNLFVDLVHERTSLPAQPAFNETYLIPGISVERLAADHPVYPTAGYYLYGELRGSHKALGASDDFLRLHVAASALYAPTPKLSLLVRGALGVTAASDTAELPASLRFFAGGDQSIRGYRFNTLSPVDADGRSIGGRHLLFASIEAQYSVHRLAEVAVFVDGGGAFNSWGDPLQLSAGVGVHFLTPIGRVRLEFAHSLTEDRSWRLHLSIRPDL